MITKDSKVTVIAKNHTNLIELSGEDSPLKNSCGAMGRIIAEKVLNGGGQADITISDLKMAIDCEAADLLMLENFYFKYTKSGAPLMLSLINALKK